MAAEAEGYTDSKGRRLVPIDPHDARHSAELIAYAMGLTPTRLRERMDEDRAKFESRAYYMLKRELVLKDMAFAMLARDREARADAFRAIQQYNRSAPIGLGISPSDMKRSVLDRLRRGRLREKGLPYERRFRPLYHRIGEAYREPEEL
jgi:hypothetical protein